MPYHLTTVAPRWRPCAMAVEPVVVARGIRCGYGHVEVLHGIDLEVRPGEVVALFGPNGAGKTTLLLALAGILPLRGGEIVRHGSGTRPIPAYKVAQHGTTLVAERNVFMKLTVEENLRIGRGRPEDAYEIFPPLRDLARRRVGSLSGGEQQMLSLGRAFSGRPALLLIDELSLGLAPLVVARLLKAIRGAADDGLGILVVEQHVSRALAVADRGYVLSHGEVAAAGSASDLGADVSSLASAYLS